MEQYDALGARPRIEREGLWQEASAADDELRTICAAGGPGGVEARATPDYSPPLMPPPGVFAAPLASVLRDFATDGSEAARAEAELFRRSYVVRGGW